MKLMAGINKGGVANTKKNERVEIFKIIISMHSTLWGSSLQNDFI